MASPEFAATCRSVDVVAAGNDVAGRPSHGPPPARSRYCRRSIDVARYRPAAAGGDGSPTIVWIGSPENLIYLEMIRPALARLTARHPALKVRVICSRFPAWPEINVEGRPLERSHGGPATLAAAHTRHQCR